MKIAKLITAKSTAFPHLISLRDKDDSANGVRKTLKDSGFEPSENVVIILESDYKRMQEDVRFLRALETAGVDNWDRFSYAQEILED